MIYVDQRTPPQLDKCEIGLLTILQSKHMMIRALLHIAFYSGKQHTTGDGLMPMVNLARYVLYRIHFIIITHDALKIIFISDSTQSGTTIH